MSCFCSAKCQSPAPPAPSPNHLPSTFYSKTQRNLESERLQGCKMILAYSAFFFRCFSKQFVHVFSFDGTIVDKCMSRNIYFERTEMQLKRQYFVFPSSRTPALHSFYHNFQWLSCSPHWRMRWFLRVPPITQNIHIGKFQFKIIEVENIFISFKAPAVIKVRKLLLFVLFFFC